MARWPQQYVQVNGVQIPTGDFIRNKDRYMKQIEDARKKELEKKGIIVEEKSKQEEKQPETEKPQVEEKVIESETKVDEEKPTKEEELEQQTDDVIAKQENIMYMPARGEMIKAYKAKFGKFPAPKMTNEVMFKKVNDLE